MAGPGGRQIVSVQPRQAPIHSLLTAAEIVPQEVNDRGIITDGPLRGLRRDGPRWMNGITYRREKCGVAGGLPFGCDADDNSEYIHSQGKTVAADDDAIVTTDPFLVWAGDKCSAMGWEQANYVGRATNMLAASEAYRVEHEFWTGTLAKQGDTAGVDYSVNQWLAQTDTSTVLNSGTVTNPGRGLGLLQAALGDCAGGGPGMIHFPAKLLPAFEALNVVTPVPASGTTPARIVDGRGNRMVPGFGYRTTGPDGNAAPAGQTWVYATGMVYVYRDDTLVFPNTFAEALDRTKNTITFRAERAYLVDWDRCCHFAVLVDDDVASD